MRRQSRVVPLALLAWVLAAACALLPATATPPSPARTATPRLPVERSSDEPYVITGSIPFTQPSWRQALWKSSIRLQSPTQGFSCRSARPRPSSSLRGWRRR
jgi:hypothetical protein